MLAATVIGKRKLDLDVFSPSLLDDEAFERLKRLWTFWGSGGWVNYFATTFLPPATTLQLLVNYLKNDQLLKTCIFIKNRKMLSFPMIPVFYCMTRNVMCAHMRGKTSQSDPQRA